MTDPRRICDEAPGTFEATLLDALRQDRPDPAARTRALSAMATLGGSASFGLAANVTSGGSVPAKSSLVAAKAALGAKSAALSLAAKCSLAGVVFVAAAHVASPRQPALSAFAARSEHASTILRSAEDAPEELVVAPFALRQLGSAAPSPLRPMRPAEAQAEIPTRRHQAGQLGREVAFLAAARRALEAGRTRAALTHLRTYEASFRDGVLAQEAKLLRVLAWVESGRREQAEAGARALLASADAAAYAPQLRAVLEKLRASAEQEIVDPLHGQ